MKVGCVSGERSKVTCDRTSLCVCCRLDWNHITGPGLERVKEIIGGRVGLGG